MYLYIELWRARPSWLALSPEKRGACMAQLGPGIEALLEAGIDIVGWVLNDADTPNRGDYSTFREWTPQSRKMDGRITMAD